MSFKHKFSYEEKVKILSEYLDGTYGFREVCRRYNINQGSLKDWKRLYETFGWSGLKTESKKYQVSYQQARSYTIKYESGGVEALKDNRGKRKYPDKMNELEKLRAEVKILKAEKERAEMEASFLKKLEEIERRRG